MIPIDDNTHVYQIKDDLGLDDIKFGETLESFQQEVKRLQRVERDIKDYIEGLNVPSKAIITRYGVAKRLEKILHGYHK